MDERMIYVCFAIMALAGLVFIYLGLTQGSPTTATSGAAASRQMGMMMRSLG